MLCVLALGILGFRAYGFGGLVLGAGGLVMWALLQWTRMLHTLKRAAGRPVGSVDNAVMLQSRLHTGMTLLHVTGLAQALGKQLQQSSDSAQGSWETFAWADAGNSVVHCHFDNGRLVRWELVRP